MSAPPRAEGRVPAAPVGSTRGPTTIPVGSGAPADSGLENPRWGSSEYVDGDEVEMLVDGPGLDGRTVRFVVERAAGGGRWEKVGETTEQRFHPSGNVFGNVPAMTHWKTYPGWKQTIVLYDLNVQANNAERGGEHEVVTGIDCFANTLSTRSSTSPRSSPAMRRCHGRSRPISDRRMAGPGTTR